jgi:hypothetical protein
LADNPYLGEYEAYSAQAKTAWQTAQAKIAQQRGSYLQGYGLDAGGKPVADNPFGAYQGMMGSLAQQGEETDAAQRLKGFTGGLSRQAVQQAHRMTEQTTHDFGQQFTQGLSDFSEAEQGAASQYNNSLQNKMLEITQRAASDRAFSPADFSAVNTDPYGNPTSPESAPGLPVGTPTTPAAPAPFAPPPNTSPASRQAELRAMMARVRANHPNWTPAQVRAKAHQNLGR